MTLPCVGEHMFECPLIISSFNWYDLRLPLNSKYKLNRFVEFFVTSLVSPFPFQNSEYPWRWSESLLQHTIRVYAELGSSRELYKTIGNETYEFFKKNSWYIISIGFWEIKRISYLTFMYKWCDIYVPMTFYIHVKGAIRQKIWKDRLPRPWYINFNGSICLLFFTWRANTYFFRLWTLWSTKLIRCMQYLYVPRKRAIFKWNDATSISVKNVSRSMQQCPTL